MPGPDTQDVRRDVRLTTRLFWAGVGLAPLAALLLLLGPEGAPLRIAGVLAIVVVVLIGLSITLRGNPEAVRSELEDALYEEIDALRSDVRQDIGTAARATHRAFGEKFQLLSQQVHGLRVHLEASRADPGPGYERAVAGPPGYERAVAGPPGRAAVGAIGPGVASGAIGAGRAAPVGGVVRHTETVQVTTRQTIVDPPSEGPAGGTVYGADGYGRRDEIDEGWAEQRGRADGRRARQYEDEPADRRSGERWAADREDDRGVEVRMGERRAAVHADGAGAELRIEDRWASVRRDEPRYDESRYDQQKYDQSTYHEVGYDEARYDRSRQDVPRREEPRYEVGRDGAYEGQWREEPYDAGRRDGGYEGHRRDDYARPESGPAEFGAEEVRRDDRWSDERPTGRDEGRSGRHGDGAAGWRGARADWRRGVGGRIDDRPADSAPAWSATGQAGWDEGQWAGRDEPVRETGWRADSGREGERRALPALPAGGQQRGIWEGDWVEPERQPVGGRRRRDEEPAEYRYRPEPDDRWR